MVRHSTWSFWGGVDFLNISLFCTLNLKQKLFSTSGGGALVPHAPGLCWPLKSLWILWACAHWLSDRRGSFAFAILRATLPPALNAESLVLRKHAYMQATMAFSWSVWWWSWRRSRQQCTCWYSLSLIMRISPSLWSCHRLPFLWTCASECVQNSPEEQRWLHLL